MSGHINTAYFVFSALAQIQVTEDHHGIQYDILYFDCHARTSMQNSNYVHANNTLKSRFHEYWESTTYKVEKVSCNINQICA